MKKFFALLMIFCLLLGTLAGTALAAGKDLPDPIDPTPKFIKYKVIYIYTGRFPASAPDAPAAVEYAEGETVTVAAAPELEGYIFSGWNMTDFVMPGEDVIIEGYWTAAESGEDGPLQEIPYEDTPLEKLPEPEPPIIVPPVVLGPPVVTEPDDGDVTELPDEDAPLAELPEAEVPLAEVPKTGDNAIVWLALAALSLTGLTFLLVDQRRKN